MTFDIVRGNLVYFSRFGILYQEKSGNPDEDTGNNIVGAKQKSWRNFFVSDICSERFTASRLDTGLEGV
jgi:hypothetical protein